jgi:hypothetical protein
MNFKEAYQKMLEGKKVRRKGWEGWQYYSLIEDNICFAGKLIVPNITVEDSLADDWEVVVEKNKIKVWEPSLGDLYYYINSNGDIKFSYYNTRSIDKRCIGNFFKTDEEAAHMAEKLKVIKELRDFALEHNDEEIDWVDNEQDKWEICYKDSNDGVKPAYNIYYRAQAFNIYFTSLEIAKEAIKKIGEDRIKKYYFDIED